MKLSTFFLSGLALTSLPLLQAQDRPQIRAVEEASVRPTEIPFDKAEEIPDAAYGLIANARVVWLGEMHGTNEAPLLFLGLVRLVARHETPPVVALEIPFRDQAAIDDYMKTGDETILKSRTFFSWKAKDGRSSYAMAKLLLALRTERIERIVCFDPAPAIESGQDRDEKMATRLAQCAGQYPKAKIVVLSGGVHSSVTKGPSWDPSYRPAAFELSKTIGPVATFNLRYEHGTIWAIIGSDSGGVHEVRGLRWSGSPQHYISLGSTPTGGHKGIIFSRTLTASPPWP